MKIALVSLILLSSSTHVFSQAIETCLDDNGFPASCDVGTPAAILNYVSSNVSAGQITAFAWAGGNEAFADTVTIRAYKVADINTFDWNQVSAYIRSMDAAGEDVYVCTTPQLTGTPIAVCNGEIPVSGSYIMRAQSAHTINANFTLGVQTVQ